MEVVFQKTMVYTQVFRVPVRAIGSVKFCSNGFQSVEYSKF